MLKKAVLFLIFRVRNWGIVTLVFLRKNTLKILEMAIFNLMFESHQYGYILTTIS
jgi:hypothetical protein